MSAAADSDVPMTDAAATSSTDASMTDANNSTVGVKRKAEDGSDESSEKKQKADNGTPVPTSTGAGSGATSTSNAPKPIPKVIPKKVVPGAVTGPKPLGAKPVPLAATAKPKPTNTTVAPPASNGVTSSTPAASSSTPAAAASASSPPSSATTTPSTPAKVAPKKTKKSNDSDSSSSSSDSSSSDDSDSSSSDESDSDDEPLVNTPKKAAKKPTTAPASASATKRAPPRAASASKKKVVDSSSSSSDDDDSDSSDESDSSSSDSDSSDSSSVSDSSDSDSDGPRRKKRAAPKRKPAARKSSGGGQSKYKGGKAAKKGEDDSDSDSEEEGYDESKVILYPMDKYELRDDVVPLKETQGANKWWNRLRAPGDKTKWTTLEHNGILFPAEYVPHGIPLLYDGTEIPLAHDAEEVASMWATMLETAVDFTRNPTFAKNFFRDFRALLPKDSPIKELAKCDFDRMKKHLTHERETTKLIRKTDKDVRAREKKEKDLLQEIYGYALVDGYKEKVGNFRVEPPNLFRGRGDHPKTGTLKRRVRPEDIIINIGTGVPIPKPPMGHKWKGIIHNNRVTWLAFYRDNVNGDFKYIWLAPSSRFKGESDIKKYTKAQKLKKYIGDIRKNYTREMASEHSQFRQRATAIYLIDFLALRVGNEKDASEVADTVGCCSLRVEHLTFTPPRTVTFDFLGKDSMRYHNTVELDERAYKNLESFTKGKKPKEEIFDSLNTTLLNEHLKSLMPDLTAKVFRTYNASVTLEKELRNPERDISPSEHVAAKVAFYNAANREVAILCNHQRSIPKGHEAAVSKLRDQIDALHDDREELEDWIEEMSSKKSNKTDKAARAEREEARMARRQTRIEKARSEAKAKAELKKAEKAKLRAAGKAVESDSDEDDDFGVKEKPKAKPADLKKAEAALQKLKERIVNYEARLSLRDANKEVALGTSKINYMDPRITIAWCKAKEVPLESVFNKSLVTKFPWAMEVPPDWSF